MAQPIPTKQPLIKNLSEKTSLEGITDVLGDSGTQRYNGYLQEESNSLMRDSQRIETIEKMRRTDGAVRAVLNAIKAPILSLQWDLFNADDSPKGREIRDYVYEDVFGLRGRTFKDFVRESLSYLDFGYYSFEIIYIIKDGMIHLDDLSPRIPASILRFRTNSGEPGIVQQIRTDEHKGQEVDIPMEKLFMLTNEKEGDDISGQSILRTAYKHFKYKDSLYLISGIASDRYGVGIPAVKLPVGYGDAEKAEAEELAENVRSSDKSFVVLPPGFEFEIVTPNGNPMGDGIEKMIEHHNRMIMMSVLAQFLTLGSGETGSFALSSDHSSFFLRHVEDKVNYWRDQFNNQVIKRLVDFNFGEQETYPELTNTPVAEKDLKEYSEILKNLKDAGIIEIDTDLKVWARPTFKLPEYTDDQIEEMRKKEDDSDEMPEMPVEPKEPEAPEVPEIPQEDGDQEDAIDNQKLNTHENINFLADQPFRIMRKLTEQEKRVDLRALNEEFNSVQSDFENDLADATNEEIDKYVESLQRRIDKEGIAAIGVLALGFSSKVRKIVLDAIIRSFEYGKKTAAKELSVTRDKTPKLVNDVMKIDSEDLAKQYVSGLDQKSRDVIKNGVIKGAKASAIAVNVQEQAKSEAAKMITNMSGLVSGQYVNRGRYSVFESNLTKIQKFQRSEVLDADTCNMCLTLDKRVVKADDPIAQMDIVHTHCRGLWVPVFEQDAEKPDLNPVPKTALDNFDTIDGIPTVNSFKQIKRAINGSNEKVQQIIRDKMK